MSQEVKIILTDDLDGGEAVATVAFYHDGFGYEIDLNEHNIDMFNKAMQPYLDAGRRVGKAKMPSAKKPTLNQPKAAGDAPAKKAPGTRTPAPGVVPGHTAREVRDWARSNKLDVPEKGRIPQEIADAFATAHAEPAAPAAPAKSTKKTAAAKAS